MRRLASCLIALSMTLPASAAERRVLLIRGLLDYAPMLSPMTPLAVRLQNEGYSVTMITHLADGLYAGQRWDAVIGHSMGAIDALRDAPQLAAANPHLTIVALDPPPTSSLFACVPGVRYLDMHTAPIGLGGGSIKCGDNVDMGGTHIMLPIRDDVQDRVVAFLQRQPMDEPRSRVVLAAAGPIEHLSIKKPPPKLATATFNERFAAISFSERWAAIGD